MPTTININLDHPVRPLERLGQECIASCHAYLSLREDYREHFRFVQRTIGFRRIRFHAVLHDLVGIYNEDDEGSPVYNFQNLDKIYDFFLSCGCRPFVELSFMPEKLASGPETCFKYKGNTTPPADEEKWRELIRAFAAHLLDRYGVNEVLSWYFEVWNEPNLDYFWRGGLEGYLRLYQVTAEALKSVHPQLRVGGPATAGTEWVDLLLGFCGEHDVPIDFITTHHYCANSGLVMGKPTRRIRYLGWRSMVDDVEKVRGQVARSHRPDLPVFFTEWNVSPSHEDAVGKDSEFNAAFVLQVLASLRGKLDGYAYWTFSDIFEESGPGLLPFTGKYGLVNMHGIPKPVYHAFRFLSRLYDCEIPVEPDWCIATRSGSGDVRFLTWNLVEPTQTDFSGGEWVFPNETRAATVRITGIRGRYRVRCYRVDRGHGNAFRAWQRMGKPQYLSDEQISDLTEFSQPTVDRDEILVLNGETSLDVSLEQNAILFWELERV